MTDERLTSLAMISIERETSRKLDLSKIVSIFATEKARKNHFRDSKSMNLIIFVYVNFCCIVMVLHPD